MDSPSSTTRMALEAGSDRIADSRDVIKAAYNAAKKRPSQNGESRSLQSGSRYGNVGIVSGAQAGLKLAHFCLCIL